MELLAEFSILFLKGLKFVVGRILIFLLILDEILVRTKITFGLIANHEVSLPVGKPIELNLKPCTSLGQMWILLCEISNGFLVKLHVFLYWLLPFRIDLVSDLHLFLQEVLLLFTCFKLLSDWIVQSLGLLQLRQIKLKVFYAYLLRLYLFIQFSYMQLALFQLAYSLLKWVLQVLFLLGKILTVCQDVSKLLFELMNILWDLATVDALKDSLMLQFRSHLIYHTITAFSRQCGFTFILLP